MAADSTTKDIAWVVGVGESAGLGAAVARRYAAGGMHVAVSGRSAARIDGIADEIRQAGGAATAVVADVSDEASVKQAAVEVARLGTLRAGVFNAGNSVRGGLLDLSAAEFEATWRGSTLAGFLFAQAVVTALLAGGPQADAADQATGIGSLLFTGATASVRGGAKFAAFASAKSGLRSLTQSLARDFGPQGIHVAHVVVDGGIDGARQRSRAPDRVAELGVDGMLSPDAIAETYWQLHRQHRSAWTLELDVRPFKEKF